MAAKSKSSETRFFASSLQSVRMLLWRENWPAYGRWCVPVRASTSSSQSVTPKLHTSFSAVSGSTRRGGALLPLLLLLLLLLRVVGTALTKFPSTGKHSGAVHSIGTAPPLGSR